MSEGALLIRADANARIGVGHLMRCLALAEAWMDGGGTVTVAAQQLPGSLAARLVGGKIRLVEVTDHPGSRADVAQTATLAREIGAAWVVVDGYQFDADYQRTLKDAGLRVLFMDDYGHAKHYSADLVLNQNLGAATELYTRREASTKLLLGSRYVLLRREFVKWRGWQRTVPNVARKLLVTLGGGDPDNVTLKVIQALRQLPATDYEATVVVGATNPHLATLQSPIASHPIRLVQNATNMPELMAWADLAVSAGGSTCWELAFMGLPNVILVLADNQRAIAAALADAGVAVNLGWHEDLDAGKVATTLMQFMPAVERRAEMSRRGRVAVDGEGVERAIVALCNAPPA